jgi:hypothetical protein
MSPSPVRAALAVVAVVALLVGCSARGLAPGGVFRSDKGYRVAIPGEAWAVVDGDPTDLHIRHRSGDAGILVHAACDPMWAARPPSILRRHLLVGLKDRNVLEQHAVTLAGKPAHRVLLDAALETGAGRMRIEAWTMTDGRCVYDLAYAAPAAQFGAWHEDFARVLGSFTVE